MKYNIDKRSIMLSEITTIREILEDNRFKKLSSEKKEILIEKGIFNEYTNFEYCEDGGYIFLMDVCDFNNFEYTVGMQHEREYIENLVRLGDNVLVFYSYDCKRAKKLIELIEVK